MALVLCACATPAAAQTETPPPTEPVAGPVAPPQEPPPEPRHGFFSQFKDEEDGKFDFSNILAKGGFLPMPVIITEPAVDGGFGIVAQFIKMDPSDPKHVTRRMVGAVKTGNGSYGYGYFQSGRAFNDRLSYKFGIGRGKITLSAYPKFLPSGFEYTNHYDYGILGSAMLHLADDRFSLGPMIDFRKLRSSVRFPNLPADLLPDFERKLNTGALGAGFHFDDRDNAISPTRGLNAYAEAKFNAGAFGSDRDFQIYDADVYAFGKLAPRWNVGVKYEVDAARGNFPIFFAPAVDLRGIEASHYQGSTVISTEVEVTRRLNDRWSLLAFGGWGATSAGDSRLFSDQADLFAGGAGFRYRIARKLGIDAGVDVAVGPGGTIFYIQFGHAWSMGMD